MRNFQKKKGWGHIIESWPVLIFLGVVLLFFAFGVWGLLGKMEVTRENKKLAEDKLAGLQKDKEKLSYDIKQLNTVEGKEASIREKFGFAKEGEGLIMVVDEKKVVEEKVEPSGLFSFFKNWFK